MVEAAGFIDKTVYSLISYNGNIDRKINCTIQNFFHLKALFFEILKYYITLNFLHVCVYSYTLQYAWFGLKWLLLRRSSEEKPNYQYFLVTLLKSSNYFRPSVAPIIDPGKNILGYHGWAVTFDHYTLRFSQSSRLTGPSSVLVYTFCC